MKPTKVIILQRIILGARFPLFDKLGQIDQLCLKVLHGNEFKGTKLVNTTRQGAFESESLYSFQIKGRTNNDTFFIPFTPFLFFKLIIENPDVIITEGVSNIFNAIQGFIYAKLFRKKIIWYSLGGLQNRTHTGIRAKIDFMINYIERKSDAIICYSTFGKGIFLQRNIREEDIFVAVNVIDTESRQEEIKKIKEMDLIHKDKDKIRLLFVGALDKVKRVDLLLEMMEVLSVKYPSVFELYVVGGGSIETDLKQVSESKGLTNCVFFTGKVFDGVSKYFLSSDLFILPGLGGLAISDSLVHGLPVIASVADGVEKDLIINNENGYLFLNEMQLDELSNKVIEFYQNNTIPYLKQNASSIIKKYNMTNYVNQFYNAIKYSLEK